MTDPGLLIRFAKRPAAVQLLACEAALLLTASWLLLRILPFAKLASILRRLSTAGEAKPDEELKRREIGQVVAGVARQMGFTCFTQGLAVKMMFHRRKLGSTLYYGVAMLPCKGLSAHVWVGDGAEGFIGHESASGFSVLASFH